MEKIQKKPLSELCEKENRCIHNLKSDLNKNMDHMLNSGTEPSSDILSKKKIQIIFKMC